MVLIIAFLILGISSEFVLARYVAAPEFHAKTIAYLENKQKVVEQLTAASVAASATITLFPGDTGTPIAEKLADFSTYFLVVMTAIFLEKYLIAITGFVSFRILIPIACLLFIGYLIWSKNKVLKELAWKLLLLGIVIVLVIPASVELSTMIESVYQTSIEETIQDATNLSSESTTEAEEDGTAAQKEKQNEKQTKGLVSDLTDKITDTITDKITDTTDALVAKAETMLNNFIEAFAVMLVTTCLIPILVMWFFVWMIRSIVSANMDVVKNSFAIDNITKTEEGKK